MRSIMAVAVPLLALAMLEDPDAGTGSRPRAAYRIIPARLIVCPAGDSAYSIVMHGISDIRAAHDRLGRATLRIRAGSSCPGSLRSHLGHYAPGRATPVASPSWGAIKLLYQ